MTWPSSNDMFSLMLRVDILIDFCLAQFHFSIKSTEYSDFPWPLPLMTYITLLSTQVRCVAQPRATSAARVPTRNSYKRLEISARCRRDFQWTRSYSLGTHAWIGIWQHISRVTWSAHIFRSGSFSPGPQHPGEIPPPNLREARNLQADLKNLWTWDWSLRDDAEGDISKISFPCWSVRL